RWSLTRWISWTSRTRWSWASRSAGALRCCWPPGTTPGSGGWSPSIRTITMVAGVSVGAPRWRICSNVPVLGATVSRLRNYPIVRRVFEGGLYRKESLPRALAREMYLVGNRRGHNRAFMSLVRHWGSWEAGRAEYRAIDRPTLSLY